MSVSGQTLPLTPGAAVFFERPCTNDKCVLGTDALKNDGTTALSPAQ